MNDLIEYCQNKIAFLDTLGGELWGCGDFDMISKNAWKLTRGDNEADS